MLTHSHLHTVDNTFRTRVSLGLTIEFPGLKQTALLIFRRIITFQCILNQETIRQHVIIIIRRNRRNALQVVPVLVVIIRTAFHVERAFAVTVGKSKRRRICTARHHQQSAIGALYHSPFGTLQVISPQTVRFRHLQERQRSSPFVGA